MKNIKKVLIGILAGIITGLFSTGGGLILVPAFMYLLKEESKKARGTSVFCILFMHNSLILKSIAGVKR